MRDWKKNASSDSVYAMWHDPSTYDPMHMGPPYLPGQAVRTAGTAKEASVDALGVRELVAAEKSAADGELSALLSHFVTDFQDQSMAELSALLVYMRSLSFLHWTHHWQTRGPAFYADHQLFERLYSETTPMIDKIAERAVGAGSPVLVNPVFQAAHSAAIIKSLYNGVPLEPGPEQLVLLSLKGVLRFLILLQMVYEALEQKGLLKTSPGTDNLIQDVADQHEGFAYLLKQRSSTKLSNTRPKRDWKVG